MQIHARQDARNPAPTSARADDGTRGAAAPRTDNRPAAGTLQRLQSQANHGPRAAQLQGLQQLTRQSKAQASHGVAQAQAVAQLTKKDQIQQLGFTATDADDLKAITQGWESAYALAQVTTVPFLRRIVATGHPLLLKRRILNQLDDHYYSVGLAMAGNYGGDFVQLVNKGLNSKLVDSMTGQVAPLRALVMTMSTNGAFTDLSKLGFIYQYYPAFVPIISAQIGGAAAMVQTLITWLGGLRANVLGIIETATPNFVQLQAMQPALTNTASMTKILAAYPGFQAIFAAQMLAAPVQLQTVITHLGARPDDILAWLDGNAPSFAVLGVLAAQDPDKPTLGKLVSFAKEAAPADNAYEQIGAKANYYRIGHFALGHTLRGMAAVPALNGTKTLWPAATTLAQVRGVCQDFDANNGITPNTAEAFPNYTPTVAPTTPIYAAKNQANNRFDQLYPHNGDNITPADATKLGAINAVKNDWTAVP